MQQNPNQQPPRGGGGGGGQGRNHTRRNNRPWGQGRPPRQQQQQQRQYQEEEELLPEFPAGGNVPHRRPGEIPETTVRIPNAFSHSLHSKRVREKGRVFTIPSNFDPTVSHQFAVVERTIIGIDDILYNKSRAAWEHLPRGNVRVFLREAGGGGGPARYTAEGTGERYTLVGAVSGLRKFGYNDNERYGFGGSIVDGKERAPGAATDVTHVIAVEKENGECGHISAISIEGSRGPGCLPPPPQQQAMAMHPGGAAVHEDPNSGGASGALSDPAFNFSIGTRLFVGQVPGVCTEEQLLPYFTPYGDVLEVKIIRDRRNRNRSKGSAWVRYATLAQAEAAIAALHEQVIVPPQVSPLRVLLADPSPSPHTKLAAQTVPPPAPAAAAAATTDTITTQGAIDMSEEKYWIVGSKNVHIVTRFSIPDEDLCYYEQSENNKRYTYAIKIARLFRDVYLQPQPQQTGAPSAAQRLDAMLRFHQMLSAQQYTACGEAIFADSQHLVDYRGQNLLRFYALTRNDMDDSSEVTAIDEGSAHTGGGGRENAMETEEKNQEEKEEEKEKECDSLRRGLCLDVVEAEALYRAVGLDFSARSGLTAIYASADSRRLSEAYTALIDEIGRRTNSEGCVMYGYHLDADSPQGGPRVLRMWKEKSYPYVMERAAREAITQHLLCGRQLRARMTAKLEMQGKALRRYFDSWERERLPWLCHFSSWLQIRRVLYPGMRASADGRERIFAVRNQWLSYQRQFGAETAADGALLEACEIFQSADAEAADGRGPHSSNTSSCLDGIVFVGPQGSGKSTLARALFYLLQRTPRPGEGAENEEGGEEGGHYRPRWVNQDESGNRNNFLAAIAGALRPPGDDGGGGGGVTHLIVDKMNLARQAWVRDYAEVPVSLVLHFYHPELGARGMLETCYHRVVGRGAAHRTIRLPLGAAPAEVEAEKKRIWSFMSKAVRDCEMPEPEDTARFAGGDDDPVDPEDRILGLDVTAPAEDQLALAWERLRCVGRLPLPAIDPASADGAALLAAALRLSKRYEEILSTQERPPVYGCIAIDSPDALLALVDAAGAARSLAGLAVQRAFHITTKYFVGDPDPVLFVALAERAGERINVTLRRVIADDKGACVVVDRAAGDFPCANRHPHITLANRVGVPPKYSNELIERFVSGTPEEKKGIRVFELPPQTTITGTFTFR